MESVVVFEDRENLNDFLEEAELSQYSELFREILKVTKVSQLKFVQTEDLIQIGLSRPEQRRYKKIYANYFPNPYISKLRKILKSNKKREQNFQSQTSIPLESLSFFENNVKVPTKHIIFIEDITINKELGTGQFGVVQQGTWTTGNQRLQVAIKCLGNERMTSNSTEFLKEAAVMHSIEHPNIVRLYGVVLHLDSLMLVTELAPLRSLLECLREMSFRLNFSVPNLCEFAEQICDGMTYLESKRLIHRDLAARNILVFSKDKVKISDFGLSRALGVGKDYYQTNYNVNLKLPVAWCAPECILYLRFTSASDVWAYGVCLWEMFTYGFQPWAAFSGQQILEAIDAPNFQRLERPECCPEAYYTTMLECWAHDFKNRPKFKDLGPRLRSIRPEQVQTTVDSQKAKDGRRTCLEYKSGQVITILRKEHMSQTSLWYGVLPGGTCGVFDPSHTKPYTPEKNVCHVSGTLSPHPMRSPARTLRSSLLRSDVKRHTYTGKRTIQRSMISSPQGDVKHTGHVGLDGAYFGDISFLDPAGCPPRQVVTPYKPSEDLEQVPLINPNSPSHLTGASGTTPYPMLTSTKPTIKIDCDEVDLSCDKTKSSKKPRNRTLSESTSSKGIISKVKSATLGRSHKTDNGAVPKTDEVHEYHEIIDTDAELPVSRRPCKPEELSISTTDFSQSLLDEMESLFRNLGTKGRDDASNICSCASSVKSCKVTESQHTLTKAERKKSFSTSTMKPMSAHDEKTLNTAVALAQEISEKPHHEQTKPDSEEGSPTSTIKRMSARDEKTLDTAVALVHKISEKPHHEQTKPDSEEGSPTSTIKRMSARDEKTLDTAVALVHKISEKPHHNKQTKAERKKGSSKRTIKRMSVRDEKTLNISIALAQKISGQSMNDLGGDKKYPHSPSERSKFNFKFPSLQMSLHHTNHAQETEKEKEPAGRSERRNFSEEAKTVPDLQSTITAESKKAYASLIEDPTPSTSMVSDLAQSSNILKAATMPKPSRVTFAEVHCNQDSSPQHARAASSSACDVKKAVYNVLPLPPRSSKLVMVDKRRHFRKYPLKLPAEPIITVEPVKETQPVLIYQNTKTQEQKAATPDKVEEVFDEVDAPHKDTNPFAIVAGPSTVNPFRCDNNEDFDIDDQLNLEVNSDFDSEVIEIAEALVKDCKDHVSVEDLLEFADQKPCGRQRGVESDEVRIMSKVLKQQASPEQCLEALELSDWNVHLAIKMVRVKVSAVTSVSLEDCFTQLVKNNGDVVKAAASLVSCKPTSYP